MAHPGLDALAGAVAERDAGAFVHVGDRFDATMRYLTGYDGPERPATFVSADDQAVLCVTETDAARAAREFPGVVYGPDDCEGTPGERAVAVLDATADDGTVLAPPHLPHDAALRVERAGYDLASTTAVAEARRQKTDAEREHVRSVAAAAEAGVRRAATVLAATDADGGRLVWDGDPLTTERLRREVDIALADEGVSDAGNTVVETTGPGDAGDPIEAGATVLVDLAPRGPAGYHARLARTFAVAGEGGWERRAHVAVERGLRLATGYLSAGTPVEKLHQETHFEVAAYGFGLDDVEEAIGHGVGLRPREPPFLPGDGELVAGDVVSVAPTIADPEQGRVRLADLYLVTEDGFEALTTYPRSMVPDPEP
ncbi:M24 family metallopeptidase [Halobacteriaceae archaeon GCM10025711]